MHSIITSYLLQAGKCALPGIGFFKLKFKSAEIDIVNKQMLPPVEEVVFSEQALFLSPGFVNYLAVKKNIPAYEAEGLVNTFCREWKERLESGESLYLESIGCLQKNTAGIISFTKQKCPEYFKPVPAEKVFHVNTEHAVLVGDKQTTSTVMNEYYREESPVAKRRWVVGAIILGAIAIVILSYNFYNHKFSRSSIGNRSHFVVKPAGETYFKP
jgi:nucleoid DNA-binding protein